MKLMIVESPNKVATIQGILGSAWKVEASVGHITELANEGTDNLGFEITPSGVKAKYVPRGDRGSSVIKKLKASAQSAELIVLATDPDREGEAIAWHLLQQVVGKRPYKRCTYNEITESAIKAALNQLRDIDFALVESQRSRQIVDKLAGYGASGIVRQFGAGKSAGRVQSAALDLLCDREKEIKDFKPVPYWSAQCDYSEGFSAVYWGIQGQPIEGASDEEQSHDDSEGAKSQTAESKRITTQADADRIIQLAKANPHKVMSVEGKLSSKNPPPALTTSSLQQVLGVKYGMSSDQAMSIAQQLFEGVNLPDGTRHGVITYLRTDSVQLSPEFCAAAKGWLQKHHPQLVPQQTAKHRDKASAQGAHEAIRPTHAEYTPDIMKDYLSPEQLKVYTVIWQRAIASQCAPATFEKTAITIQSGPVLWMARGSILKSEGYTRIWQDVGGDVQLPAIKQGTTLTLKHASHSAKQTQPPGRYSEPTLIKTLEKLGIGRPSTYAAIMKTLKEQEYVSLQGRSLVPTPTGMKNNGVLLRFCPILCDPKFTAKLEGDLDLIAEGKKPWERYLHEFNGFFSPLLSKAKQEVAKLYTASSEPCPQCQQPLSQIPVAQPKDKDHYLKCMSCYGVVLFWNGATNSWVQPQSKPKSSRSSSRSAKTAGATPCSQARAKSGAKSAGKGGQRKSKAKK